MIYVLQDTASLHIKIGWTGQSEPRKRINQVQAACPADLLTLAVVADDLEQMREVNLHRRFALAHVRCEWFRPVPELIAFVRGLNPSAPLLDPSADPHLLCSLCLRPTLDRGPAAG